MAEESGNRRFGRTGVKVSALGMGGHHLGEAMDENTAVEIIHRSVDGGISFFDCCWEYNRGKSEDWLTALSKGASGAEPKRNCATRDEADWGAWGAR